MKKIPKSIRRVLVTTLFLAGVIVMQFQTGFVAFAATKTWTGVAGDNKFSTATNWSGNAIPVNGDTLSFDVTSLTADKSLNNDLTNLSLTGMTFSGANDNYRYHITGNALTVSGSLLNNTTSTAGSAIASHFIQVPLTLSGNVVDHDVWLSNVNMQTYSLSLSAATDNCNTYVELGSLSGTGTITVTNLGALLTSNNSGFTGNLVINSGAMVSATVAGVSAMSSITSNGGGLEFQQVTANATVPVPLNLSGTLSANSEDYRNCAGGSDPVAPGTVLSFTGGLNLNGNLVYKSDDSTSPLGVNVDANVTAPFVSNGHTVTNDPNSVGHITVAPEVVNTVSGAPTNLVATPSSAQAALTWTAPVSNGGSAITDYVVKYKLSSSGTWLTFADGTSATTGATVTGLTNGSSYDFQVAAVNTTGTSAYVTITGITVSAALTTPTAPSALGATVNSTSHNIVLNWTAPASDGGSAITNYLVEAKLSSSSTWSTVTHTAFTGTSFEIFSGLTDGATYDFRVTPVNAQGNGTSTTVTNYTYTAGTGSTGNIGNAGGVGNTQTVTAPNTGFSPFKNLQIKSPFAVVIFGLASVAAVLFVAWPRRTN